MVTSVASDPLIGSEVDGRYRVLRRLAEGGMAVVYLAVDTRLDREVALKVLYPHLAADPEFVARFRREAQSAARLSHPHLVAVFDQFEDGGNQFLAMEYVPGKTMADLIRREGAMAPRRAAGVILPVLDALGYAHGAGFLHRDVKPENVLIRRDGVVKLADFGLARTITSRTSTSATGVVLGTAAYLSPEQVERGIADARSDVYAAGLLLFEALTGTKAFPGDNAIHVAYQHVHGGVPALTDRVDAVPQTLADVVEAATSRDPDDRPADGRALAAMLRTGLRQTLPADLDRRPRLLTAGPAPGLTQPLAMPSVTDETVEAVDAVGLAAPLTSPRTAQLTGLGATNGAERTTRFETGSGATGSGASGSGVTASVVTGSGVAGSGVAGSGLSGAGGPDDMSDEPPRRRVGAIVAFVVAALVVGVGGWFFLAGPGASTTVPPVAGQSVEAAIAALDNAHLGAKTDEVFSETVPVGQVAGSDPPAGASAHRGEQITLHVSKGPERYAVPKVVGLSQADAEQALAEHQSLGAVSQDWSDTVKAGLVISQNPKAGTPAKPGVAVALVISKGPKPVDIPDYTGKPAKDATAALKKLGFTVTTGTPVNSDSVPSGSVVSQTPSSGSGFRGDTITLVVSKGPVLVTVPDVRRLQESVARAQLEALGFTVKAEYPYGNFFGTVRDTKPGHGKKVPQGSTIVMTVF